MHPATIDRATSSLRLCYVQTRYPSFGPPNYVSTDSNEFKPVLTLHASNRYVGEPPSADAVRAMAAADTPAISDAYKCLSPESDTVRFTLDSSRFRAAAAFFAAFRVGKHDLTQCISLIRAGVCVQVFDTNWVNGFGHNCSWLFTNKVPFPGVCKRKLKSTD